MQPKQPKAETQAMSEYGEPWVYSVNEADDEHYICDANGGHIVDCVGGDLLYEEIERIVACVNAMQGIPNPEAVRELIEACRDSFGECNRVISSDEYKRITKALAALSASTQQK